MKFKTIGFWLIALLFLSFSISTGPVLAGNIKWHPFEEGMALSQKEKKKVYLHFWAEWCTFCRKMEKETFSDTSVVAYLNKHFVSIRVNSDKQREIANSFEVTGLPDNWFVDENGQAISNRSGYIAPKMFLPIIKYIRTDSYKKMSFNQFLKEM